MGVVPVPEFGIGGIKHMERMREQEKLYLGHTKRPQVGDIIDFQGVSDVDVVHLLVVSGLLILHLISIFQVCQFPLVSSDT